MAKSKACGKDIAKGVKQCVHCGKDQRNFFMRHKVLTGVLVVFILFIFGNVVGSEGGENEAQNEIEKDTDMETEDASSEEEEKDSEEAETDEATGSTDSAEEEIQDDDVPREYQSALNKAESYADSMDMSKAANYDQLVSE